MLCRVSVLNARLLEVIVTQVLATRVGSKVPVVQCRASAIAAPQLAQRSVGVLCIRGTEMHCRLYGLVKAAFFADGTLCFSE